MGDLSIGVIGLGLGAVHAAAYDRNEAVGRLVVCDPDQERAADVMRDQQRIDKAYAGLEEMLDAEELDGVSIVTPDHLHRGQVEQCLRAKCHVLVTKPIATNLDDARAMVRAADDAGRLLMVAHERRFRTRERAVRDLLGSGKLGDVVHVRLDDIQDKRRQFRRSPWYATAQAGRTALVGTGIHEVDLLRFYIDRPIVRVAALSNHVGTLDFPTNTTTAALFEFEGGAIGQVTVTYEAHWPRAGPLQHPFRLIGTRGVIVDGQVARDGQDGWEHLPPNEDGIVVGTTGCVDAFVHSMLTGEPVPIDGREGFRSLAACVAADASAASGNPATPADL